MLVTFITALRLVFLKIILHTKTALKEITLIKAHKTVTVYDMRCVSYAITTKISPVTKGGLKNSEYPLIAKKCTNFIAVIRFLLSVTQLCLFIQTKHW